MADSSVKHYKAKDKANATPRGGQNDGESFETTPRDQKHNEHKPEVTSKSDDNNNRKRDGVAKKQEAWVVDIDGDSRGVGDKKDQKKKEDPKEKVGDRSDDSKHTGAASEPKGKPVADTFRNGQKKTSDKSEGKILANGAEKEDKQFDGKRQTDREVIDRAARKDDEEKRRMTNGSETRRRAASEHDWEDVENGSDADHDMTYSTDESRSHDDGHVTKRNVPVANGSRQHQVGADVVGGVGRAPPPRKSDTLPRQSNGVHQQQQGQSKTGPAVADDDDSIGENDVKRRTFTGKSTLHHGASSTESTDGPEGGDPFESVNVVLRVRPLNTQETQRRDKTIFTFPGDGALWAEQPTGATKSFTYNMTFEPSASQEDVFENCGIKKLVEMAVNGYSCTAFAFGQTGSGKTYTITGPADQDTHGPVNAELKGLIPRSFYYLFYLMHKKPNAGYRLTASYLEIYNEQVFDLLNPNHRTYLPVRWSRHKGFYVENLFNVECETIEDLFAVLDEGLRNRATGSNSINEHSSRSHSVLTLHIDSEMFDEEDEKLCITKHGKLTFVDLAGSEKTKTDAATTQGHFPHIGSFSTQGHVLESNNINRSSIHLQEANNINRSLLVLGNCISALSDPKKRQGHVPYRDSKLTKLLADSLRGNAVTLMIACVSPSSFNSAESMNTLRYANRAKKVQSKPVIIMDPREKLIVSLKREIKILRQENHYLRTQLDFPVKAKGQLQRENDSKFLQMLKEQKRDGRVTEHGLYEMLQEYMIENEMLRKENTDLHQVRDTGRREQQTLARENEKLTKKLEVLLKGGSMRASPVSYDSSSMRSIDSASSTPLQSPAGPRANKLTGSDDWRQTNAAAGRGKPVPIASKKPPHHLPSTVEKNPAAKRDTLRAARSVDSLDVNMGNGTGAPGVRRSLGNGYDDVADDEEYDDRTRRAKPQPATKTLQGSTRSGNDESRKPYRKHYTAEVDEMNRQLRQELQYLDQEIQQESVETDPNLRITNGEGRGGYYNRRFRRQPPSDHQLTPVKR